MSAIFVYRLVEFLAFPLIVVYFLWRGLKDRRYFGRFAERLGFIRFHQTADDSIWLHAVSVGEVIAAEELVCRLRAEFPRAALFLSTTTLAGRATAERKLGAAVDGVFYAPIDYCFAVRRTLRRIRPRVLVVMETEIWPNLWREAKRVGCALVVVNGRVSDRSLPRYRRWVRFFRPVLSLPDAILAQDRTSCGRFLELGAGRARLAGNLKYDFDPARAETPRAVKEYLERVRPEAVWIAASTTAPAEAGDPDEDEAAIAAFLELRKRHPGLLLILVPRKPERFDGAAEKLAAAGIAFARRSRLEGRAEPCLLLDSMGELSSLFPLADVVFMGGTLARRGGHNLLEPAFFAKPVIVGPHMENFAEIAGRFREREAVVEIENAEALAGAVGRLLEDAGARARIGERAREAAEAERGASGRAAEEIARLWAGAASCYRHSTPALAVLWPLSLAWRAGTAWKQRRDLARRERLETPVISVGGLAAGGVGKTPVALWLAERLREAGIEPAILTRGYRRRSREPQVILAAGESAPAERTGDEAQIYLRAGVGPVGIGADRAAAGRQIEQRFRPDVFLLDDGFQYRRLERMLDIVVLDGLDPFGGCGVLPVGRLREPPEALARADVIIVSRAAVAEGRIRRCNRTAPIFTARVAPRPLDLPGRVGAFCGLGNPESFWRTLKDAGIEPVFRRAFADHHRYTAEEVRALGEEARAAGAEALLTTEKDMANLWGSLEACPTDIPIVPVEIELEVEGGQELVRLIRERLSSARRNLLRSMPPP